jgi:hypothetical protein
MMQSSAGLNPQTKHERPKAGKEKIQMNKSEKECAALYISSCLFEMRQCDMHGATEQKEQAWNECKEYMQRIRALLTEKFELFGLSYEKSVDKPYREIMQLANKMYSDRVNAA